MEKVKVLIIESDIDKSTTIQDYLANIEYISVVGEARSEEEAMNAVDELDPDVLLLAGSIEGGGYNVTEKILASCPWLSVIILEKELKEETMRKAIFAGAKDVLIYPFSPSKLVDSIYRSFQMSKKKQSFLKEEPGKRKRKSSQGQILTVFSTKGGVGKTFLSTNLAVSLAEDEKKKVVLVDLDLDFGNVTLALNVVPRYTSADVINDIRNLDQDLMESYLIPHSSGIKFLAANAQPQMTEFINAEHIEIILKVLQSAYDYVVVDMPARFYNTVDPAFQEAALLLLVTTPEVSTLRNVKSGLQTFHMLNYPKNKIKLVLNRAEPRGEIKPKDVEATLNTELFGVLPADYRLVSSSLNKGIPVVQLYPRAPISRNLQKLAKEIKGNGFEAPEIMGNTAANAN